LGRSSFFDEAVEVVMGRVAARMEQQGSAVSEEAIRDAIKAEARELAQPDLRATLDIFGTFELQSHTHPFIVKTDSALREPL